MIDTRQVDTPQAVATLLHVLGNIDHAQRGTLTHPQRLQLVKDMTRVCRMADALRATLVAEAQDENSAMIATGAPLNTFLATTGTLNAKQATAEVFAAQDVTASPQIQQAALAGHIAPRQARSIRRAMNDVPIPLNPEQRHALESELLTRARTTPPDELSKQGMAAVKKACPGILDQQTETDHLEHKAQRAYRARALRFLPEHDGSIEFNGSLPTAEATRFKNLIDTHVEAGRGASTNTDRHGLPRTPHQRQADALLDLLAYAAAGGTTSSNHPTTRITAERTRLVVTINEADLRDRCLTAGLLNDGTKISAGQLRRLACDAEILPAVLGTHSEILDVGRTARLVTPGIRRALSIRDKGCQFPHCNAPDHRCQAHHVIPFHQGGPTSLNNLILLCPYHHALIEPTTPEPGLPPPRRWKITFDTDGNPHIHPPENTPPQSPTQEPTNQQPPMIPLLE